MRRIFVLFIAVACLRPGVSQTAGQPPALPEQTGVEIELLENVSSQTLHAGQPIGFKVVEPVVANGTTVIAAGTPVQGEVATVQAAGAFRRAGEFDLVLKPLQLADGRKVQLVFPHPKRVGTAGEKTATAIAGAPILLYYFPLIPFMAAEGAKKGKAIEVRAGERYLVYVSTQPDAPGKPAEGATGLPHP